MGQVSRAYPFQTTPPVAGGLLSQYLFENNYTDEEGNYNGSAEGSVTFTTTDPGEGTYSVYLNGGDEGVNLGSMNFGSSGFSISLLYKVDFTIADDIRVLICNRASAINNDGFVLWGSTYDANDGKVLIYCGNGATQDFASTSAGALTDDVWNHIVITWDTSEWAIYVAGSDVTTDATTITDFATSGNVTMIGNYNGLNYGSDMTIDDVRVWTRVLTPTEVANIYP